MLVCPKCKQWLQPARTPEGKVHTCGDCDGHGLSVDQLDDPAYKDFLWHLRPLPGEVRRDPPRRCPRCAKEMTIRHWGAEPDIVEIDVCHPCRLIWFDDAEHLRTRANLRRSAGRAEGEQVPDHWHVLPGILGAPVEGSWGRLRAKPWWTWMLTALLLLVFAGTHYFAPAHPLWTWRPANPWLAGGWRLLSSFLVHASWLGVLVSVYFLWVLGQNAEDRLGGARYVLLLLGGHLAGVGLGALLTGRDGAPAVGAGAAVSAVAAYLVVMFPRAKIGLLGRWRMAFQRIRVPAFVVAVVYVAVGGLVAWQTSGGAGDSLAYLPPLGGLGFGALVAWVAALRRRQRVDAWR